MLGAVRTGLEAVSGHGGWHCALVGGGRRSSAVHDAGVCVGGLGGGVCVGRVGGGGGIGWVGGVG